MITKSFLFFITTQLFASCSIGYLGAKKTESPSESFYKKNLTGQDYYNNRLYSQENIEWLEKEINLNQFNHSIISHKEAKTIENLTIKSAQVNKEKIKQSIEEYIQNYTAMVEEDEKTPKPSNHIINEDYFNLEEYGKIRPPLNIATVKYLSNSQIMPMTNEVSDVFRQYYINNIDDNLQSSSDQFNPKLQDIKHEKDNYDLKQQGTVISKENAHSFLKNQVISRAQKHKENKAHLDSTY